MWTLQMHIYVLHTIYITTRLKIIIICVFINKLKIVQSWYYYSIMDHLKYLYYITIYVLYIHIYIGPIQLYRCIIHFSR